MGKGNRPRTSHKMVILAQSKRWTGLKTVTTTPAFSSGQHPPRKQTLRSPPRTPWFWTSATVPTQALRGPQPCLRCSPQDSTSLCREGALWRAFPAQGPSARAARCAPTSKPSPARCLQRQRAPGRGQPAAGKNDPVAHTLLFSQQTPLLKGGLRGWRV